MKLQPPAEKESSAPALTRGLEIVRLLAEENPLSLERIAASLSIPKASALRLLNTLQDMGILLRRSDKRYEALWKLAPVQSHLDSFRSQLEPRMQALTMETGSTVEWYEPKADGMQLILQKNPEKELCVIARPGFLRDWHTEFEAVIRLGHAFADQAPTLESSEYYSQNGLLEAVDTPFIQQAIQSIKAEPSTYDSAFNTNGVRRFAVAAFAPETNQFLGVLAIAEVYHFTEQADPKTILQRLKSTLK
jgi:Transcriptional regulator